MKNNIDKIFKMLNLEPYEKFIVVNSGNVYYFDCTLNLCHPIDDSIELTYNAKTIITGEEEIVRVSDLTSENRKIIREAQKKGMFKLIAVKDKGEYRVLPIPLKGNEKVLDISYLTTTDIADKE